MNQSKKVKIFSILALTCAIFALGLGIATLQASFALNGTAKVDKAELKVEFKEPSVIKSDAQSTRFVITPSISETTNNQKINFSAVFIKPGDSISFKTIIENTGTIDAKISEIKIINIPDEYKDLISYNISGVEKNNEILAQNRIDNVIVTLTYNEILNEEGQVINDIELNDLTLEITYEQK